MARVGETFRITCYQSTPYKEEVKASLWALGISLNTCNPTIQRTMHSKYTTAEFYDRERKPRLKIFMCNSVTQTGKKMY